MSYVEVNKFDDKYLIFTEKNDFLAMKSDFSKKYFLKIDFLFLKSSFFVLFWEYSKMWKIGTIGCFRQHRLLLLCPMLEFILNVGQPISYVLKGVVYEHDPSGRESQLFIVLSVWGGSRRIRELISILNVISTIIP